MACWPPMIIVVKRRWNGEGDDVKVKEVRIPLCYGCTEEARRVKREQEEELCIDHEFEEEMEAGD